MLITSEIKEFQGITHALQKHGGLIEVGKKLGFNPTIQYQTLSGNIVKSTYEVNLDNFLYLNNIKFCYENKIIEGENFMYDFRINDIYIEIWGYGGEYYNEKRRIKEKIYKDNNLTIISLEDKLFRNNVLLNINSELIYLMEKYKIKLDNFYNEDLSKLNYFESYNKEKVIQELRQICIENNFTIMPTIKWWYENGFGKQIRFLENKVSMYDLADLFNIKMKSKPKNFWNNFENLKKELLPICNELNRFPSQSDLNNIKRGDIINAMKRHHGGVIKIKERLNFNKNI